MKAKDLDPKFFPKQELIKAYEAAGQKYEYTGVDRLWEMHFYPKVTGNPKLKEQDIQIKIPQLYRRKDAKGKEWLTYNVSMRGMDWKGNPVDFSYVEGIIEGMPTFHYEVDPKTDEIIKESTQILETHKIYTIPFSKEKIAEISEHFIHPVHCIIVDGFSNRRYSCSSARDFAERDYEELLDKVTQYMHSDDYKLQQMIDAKIQLLQLRQKQVVKTK
jgi:hypothetical protein